jgi:hypothetical protein
MRLEWCLPHNHVAHDEGTPCGFLFSVKNTVNLNETATMDYSKKPKSKDAGATTAEFATSQ